jgi:hypothetical protein
VRRFVAIGAVTALIFAAFALAGSRHLPRVSAASSGSSVWLLLPPTVTQQGCALGPAFTFCDQAPGTTGAPVQFNVEASAAASSVSVSMAEIPGLSARFAAGDFTISGNTCTGNLAANQQCQISIAFSPTAAGLRQAQISVTDTAGDKLAFNVEGTGSQFALSTPAAASCTPAVLPDNAYMFCAQPINPTTPTTETFTLSSANGATSVNVALSAIPGLESEFASGDFTVETPPCPSTIPAGGSCSIGVAFTPTAAGLRSAALTATDSAGDTTTVYLAGPATSGLNFSTVAPSETQPCGTASDFLFCSLPVGGISASTTLTLVNSSGTQVTGLSVPTGSVIATGATSPDFTVQHSSCTSVLAAGASCTITVVFTPTASGLRQGAIVVTDAQGDVAGLNLGGVGDDYSIATQLPTEVSVIPGGTAKFSATLTPDNVLGMNGEQVSFVCPANLPTNTSCAVTPCPTTITAGTPASITVTFVTSSAIQVAPAPSAGCSTYGPSQTAIVGPPTGKYPGSPLAAGLGTATSRYPALSLLAALGAIGPLVAGLAAPYKGRSRTRLPLIFACAGLAALILTGCHHHAAQVTAATPTGVTNLNVLGNALDANGNSLNTSRLFQVTLDVVAK